MRLTAQLIERTRLTTGERREMQVLMDRHYANVQPEVFARDLDEKRWVIVLHEKASGRLCGFSTQSLLETNVDGQAIQALFSGDTIINQRDWGDPALFQVWGQLALTLIDSMQDAHLFWFLLSQGYRTYRFLPLFFHEFYPHYEHPIPAELQRTLDALAIPRYGAAYEGRIVRSHVQQYRLRGGVSDLTPEKLRDPHVRFFSEINPGHMNGDELCCLAPLTRENFTRAAFRVIGVNEAATELT